MRQWSSNNLSRFLTSSKTVEGLSRLGYAVHGLVYLVIGLLGVKLVSGTQGGQLADPPDAIAVLGRQPILGGIIATVIAAGLASYALWRILQAVTDPDKQGTGIKGLIVRTGRLVSGAGYLLLALFAVRIGAGLPVARQSQATEAVSLIRESPGAFLGGLIALVLLGVALDDVRKASTGNFGERLNRTGSTFAARCTGHWGFAARSLILFFASVYLMRAALQANPQEVKGFEGVLAAMLGMPYGNWLLGFVSLGMMSYGLFMIQAGVYRRHPY